GSYNAAGARHPGATPFMRYSRRDLLLAVLSCAALVTVCLVSTCRTPPPVPPDLDRLRADAESRGLETHLCADFGGRGLVIVDRQHYPDARAFGGPAPGILYLAETPDAKTAAQRASVRQNVACDSRGRFYFEGDLSLLPLVFP